ncbi:CRISPR-associated protein Cas5 [Fusobacterium sp. IOR10]|uniref:CRISPR-associated protein Cas5 n=1 Tax=Fusobacterium sp. IOR10 TaxID=2665157 RepID=UPI0013D114FF|nr:CRISPR-associated protein Cas5 [Fusobacterium sp. IOR10]
MKAIRLVLTQNKAHYRKEETITNKMTYPLPPISTLIGAIHNACGYRKYHEMDLSIQGEYESMGKEAYTDHCFLNSVMDDRGILVKSRNGDLQSKAFEKVAKALKSTGNSFRKRKTIQVLNEGLFEEYINLKNLNDEIGKYKKLKIDRFSKLAKIRKNSLKEKKKIFDKESQEFKLISHREEEIKKLEKLIKKKLDKYIHEKYTKEISKYQSLTTSIKYYEVLYGVKLIIHIKTDEKTLKDIYENIYNLRSIGRSEDFVEVKECELIELNEELPEKIFSKFKGNFIGKIKNSSYLLYDEITSGNLILKSSEDGTDINGTKYYLNKDYKIKNNQRIFNKVKVIYTSNYTIDKKSKNVYYDKIDGEDYLVNFL